MKKTTKKQAESYFKLYLYPQIKNLDKYSQYEVWNSYIDGLCKSGEITNKQYATWLNPRYLKK